MRFRARRQEVSERWRFRLRPPLGRRLVEHVWMISGSFFLLLLWVFCVVCVVEDVVQGCASSTQSSLFFRQVL